MQHRVECHAGYGLGGVFAGRGITALDKLMDDLSPVWDCTTWRHSEADKLFNGIVARQARYRDDPIIILIGHSAACLMMIQVAWRLNSKGIKVHYVGAIDPTALLWFGLPFLRMGPPMVASKNIAKIDEFWATSGAPHMARRADESGKSGGRYIYPSGWPGEGGKPIIVPGGHIPCASAEKTRATILASVKAVLA